MKHLLCYLLVGFLSLSVWAQPGNNAAIVGGVSGASNTFSQQVSSGDATVQWTGMGLVSGEMVDMDLANTSTSPMSFNFVPGMVLEDARGEVQPILLDESLSFSLQPGESIKKKMRGYCLDYSKSPPSENTVENYEIATDLSEYQGAIAVLHGGLRLDGDRKLKPVLRPLMHRTVVTQRAVWAVLGGQNPDSREELEKDLEDQIRYSSSIFPEGQLECLSQRLWSDVQKIMAEAAANE